MEELPKNFWETHVSKSTSKDDLPADVWSRICKMRNSPIRLVRDVIIGEIHKPHVVLPKGLKGYVIAYPEAFELREEDLESVESAINFDRIPAAICGYGEEVVSLTDDDYEIIDPFFDMSIADYAEQFRC